MYADISKIVEDHNDQISVVILAPGYKVDLYANTNYGGHHLALDNSDGDEEQQWGADDLVDSNNNSLDNSVSSYKLTYTGDDEDDAVLTLKENDDSTGWRIREYGPTSASLPVQTMITISALEVAEGYTVDVYKNSNYTGHNVIFTGPKTVHADDLKNHKPKAFSQGAYLYRVGQPSGAKTVVVYCPMVQSDSAATYSAFEQQATAASHNPVNASSTPSYYNDFCSLDEVPQDYVEYVDLHDQAAEPDASGAIKDPLYWWSVVFLSS